MKGLKGLLVTALAVLALTAGAVRAYNQHEVTTFNDLGCDDLILNGNDILDSGATTRITVGSTIQLNGKVGFGVDGTAETVTATSGNSECMGMQVYMGGAATAAEGSVLIATTTISSKVTVMVAPATSGRTDFVGVAAEAGAPGATINMCTDGFALVLATGTIIPGDIVRSTSTGAGYVGTGDTVTAGSVVGVSLGNVTAASPGLLKVRLK